MPFPRKSVEESCSNNNRKKNRTQRIASPTSFFCSPRGNKDREEERLRLRPEKRTKPVGIETGRPVAETHVRSFTTRPLQGRISPSKQTPRRIRHASSDHFSFSPPVEAAPTPTGRKTAGMHFPAANSVRNFRDYISNSLWNGKTGGPCLSPTVDSQRKPAESTMGSRKGAAFAQPLTPNRDSSRHSSQLDPNTVEAFLQNLDNAEDYSPMRRRTMSPLLSGIRRCRTPDVYTSTPSSRGAVSVLEEHDFHSTSPSFTERRGQEPCGLEGHIYKRCQYLEAEVEYLRDQEAELRERVQQRQEENSRLSCEMAALKESYQEALDAKKAVEDACAENIYTINRLRTACNKQAQDYKDLAESLESERMQWMESMQSIQDQLEQVKQHSSTYKGSTQRTSVFTDTTDTDISLNDYFEDGSPPSSSDFQAGNLSSSVNNSPGLSPRTLEDLRVENKRLLEENKRLREECEALESCRKQCQRRHKLDTFKQEGNKAFQRGNYEEALNCYAAAFGEVGDDPRMQAVLHCNRAAALYNMERFLEAIVSCCCAIDCDGSYLRTYQRRASAYEAIGDLSSAVQDITHLINSGGSTSIARDAHVQLTELQRKLKRAPPIDAYKILGLAMTASGAEIKSHYRKLALQFHPDKAQGQTGSAEAFKLISQAHVMLSDEAARKKFDSSLLRASRSSSTQRQR